MQYYWSYPAALNKLLFLLLRIMYILYYYVYCDKNSAVYIYIYCVFVYLVIYNAWKIINYSINCVNRVYVYISKLFVCDFLQSFNFKTICVANHKRFILVSIALKMMHLHHAYYFTHKRILSSNLILPVYLEKMTYLDELVSSIKNF